MTAAGSLGTNKNLVINTPAPVPASAAPPIAAPPIAVSSAAMALSNVQDLDDYWTAFAVALRL